MPLLTIARNFLDVDVSDRTPGVQQKARWVSMLAKQDVLTGEVSVNLDLQVLQYDATGTPLTGKGITNYRVPLVANNSTAVHPDTGQILYLLLTEAMPASPFLPEGQAGKALNLVSGQVEPIEPGQTWLTFLEAKPEPLRLQGDWFSGLMNAMGITPLLRQFMEQADQPPFSKFA